MIEERGGRDRGRRFTVADYNWIRGRPPRERVELVDAAMGGRHFARS